MNPEYEENARVIKHYHFNAPVGQHIDYIAVQNVSFDKDMNMSIDTVHNANTSAAKPTTNDAPSYTSYIETTAPITAIGRLIVNEANEAKTKSAFINKISQIITSTQLFRFKPTTTNSEKAIFINAVLKAYGYTGEKCKNITDDDFQRYF